MIKKEDITPTIISYYRSKRLEKCLNSLKEFKRIYVWDNNTEGEDLDKMKELDNSLSNVEFHFNKENVGWGKAANQCILNSNTDWVLISANDMIYESDWFEVLNKILEEKPHLEQIHLNAWNAMVFHKKTIARMGWWDERYKYYPTMDDDDWYLRTVETLEFSPYVNPPKHVNFPEEYIEFFKNISNREEDFNSVNNFTYYNNSPWSKYKVIGKETITGGSDEAENNNMPTPRTDVETGMQFHFRKWENIDPGLATHPESLIGKDTRIWRRKEEDVDWYPEDRLEYIKKYFGEQVYKDFVNV